MFGLWQAKNISPIGLDMGSHAIRMLQLRRAEAGAPPVVVAAARGVLPADLPASGPERQGALAAVLRQMLRSGGFTGRRVVSCLPAEAIQYKNLRLPRMPADEMRAALVWEASTHLNLGPAEKLIVQYYDAGAVRQGEELRQEIILMAAATQAIDDHLALLLECDLKPLAIDALPGALARGAGVKDDPGLDAPATVVVDVGHLSTKTLIARRGHVAFFKSIDIGGDKFDRAVAQKLNLPLPEAADLRRRMSQPAGPGAGDEPLFGKARREGVERAIFEAVRAETGELAREVGLCLRYYSVTFHGRRPEAILLAGGGAADPLLARVLAEDAGLAATAALPLGDGAITGSSDLTASGPHASDWTVAAGLAQYLWAPAAAALAPLEAAA